MKFRILNVITLLALLSLSAIAQTTPEAVRKAGEKQSKGDIRGAIRVLDKAVEKKQDLFQIYQMRATLHRMIGNTQNEFDDLEKAIAIDPSVGELYHQRAMARMFLRQDSKLIVADLDTAIANGYQVEKVYQTRAGFRRMNRDLEGALEDYQTAVGLNPESAGSIVGLASVYRQLGNDDQAIATLKNFLSKYESQIEALPVVKGRVIAKSDAIILRDDDAKLVVGSDSVMIIDDGPATEQGLKDMSYKLEQKKNTAFAYSELAALYSERGEFEKALGFVEKGIFIDPTDKQLVGVRGKIRGGSGDYKGALEDLSLAIDSVPTFPNNYLERGIVLLLLNRDDEAQQDFDRFLKILPYDAARSNLEKRIAAARKKRAGDL